MPLELLAIGMGGVARPQLQYFDALDDVDVVAGADIAAEAREWFEDTFDAPTYEDHGALLAAEGERADAATIITPHAHHRAAIEDCFDADLAVYVEKPLVVGLDAAVAVVDRARDENRTLLVGYQRHYHPAFETVREVALGGRIGEPHFAACHLEQDWIGPHTGTWRTDPEVSGGGQLYDSGSHLLDALLWTTGTRPATVAAAMDDRDREGVDVNTALAATLVPADGEREHTVTASVGVTGDGTTHPVTDEELLVVGTEGQVRYDGETVTVVETGTEPGETTTEREAFDADESGPFRAKMENFVAAVRGEEDVGVDPEDALQVIALTEAAYRARESGETVDVQSLVEDRR